MKSLCFWTAALVVSSLAVACAPNDENASADSAAAVSTGGSGATAASKELSGDFFSDADPKEVVDYVLFGQIPGSAEACSVTISRAGLTPPKNDWSRVAVHPFGASQKTVEKNGPVEEDFATPPAVSNDKDSIQTHGDQVIYSRVDPKDASQKMEMTLGFQAGSKKTFSTLESVAVAGKDAAGDKAASCGKLSVGIVLRPSEYTPIANAAEKDWEKKNGENLDDLGVELESCSVASEKSVDCFFGNDTNEETLDITFALANGRIGKVTHAERHSDFE
jgi:hypothetical protein